MQLAVDVGEVSLHRAIAEVKLRADRFVGIAARGEFEHVGFAGRQRLDRFVFSPTGQLRHELARDDGIERRLAFVHIAHRLNDVVGVGGLQDVAVRAGLQHGEHIRIVIVGREDEDADRPVLRPHVTAHVDAAALGHLNIEHGHIGL